MAISFSDSRVLKCLRAYLVRISSFRAFRSDMLVSVYSCADNGDFIAFESINYNFCFFSNKYKFVDLQDRSVCYTMPFSDFFNIVCAA